MTLLRKPLIWCIWDGASYDVVQALMAEGGLPYLQRVVESGGIVALKPPFPNCETPPALASLLTGVEPSTHGLVGRSLASLAGSMGLRSVFSRSSITVPPIWERIQRRGGTCVTAFLPWIDADTFVASGSFAVVGYENRVVGAGTIRVSNDNRAASQEWDGNRVDFRTNRAHVAVFVNGESRGEVPIRSKQLEWQDIDLGHGRRAACAALLREWRDDVLLLHGGVWDVDVVPGAEKNGYLRATKAFMGGMFGEAYRRGEFGPQASEGGDGSAEATYFSCFKEVAARFADGALTALLARADAQLFLCYQPVIDAVQHECFSAWGADAGYPGVEQKRRLIVQAYQEADKGLGKLLDVVPHASLVVTSDHGAAVVTRECYVNHLIHQLQGEGRMPPGEIVFDASESGSVWLKHGTGETAVERESVRKRVCDALLAYRDPDTHTAPVASVFDEQSSQRSWNPAFGDLFVVGSPGYQLRAGSSPTPVSPSRKGGHHTAWTGESSLYGIFVTDVDALLSQRSAVIDNHDVVGLLARTMESS